MHALYFVLYAFKKQLEDKQCISEASRDLPYYRFAHVGRTLRTQRCTWKITRDGGADGDGDGKDGDVGGKVGDGDDGDGAVAIGKADLSK